MFSGLGLAPLVLIFLAAAGAVWGAGQYLSDSTDALDQRLGLGEALGGAILLAIATNLPEIAITASAALAGSIGIAVGNILGGIAIQTVVLVVLDVATGKDEALTTRAASLVLVLEGLLVVVMLAIVVMGAQLPASHLPAHLEPASVLLAAFWIEGIFLINRARRGLPWQDATGTPPGGQPEPMGHSKEAAAKKLSLARAASIFTAAAAVTLLAGIVLEQSGDEIAGHLGLSGVIFGATILAAATALPEVSTGIASIKLGDYQLAFSDIFGGNAFLPVLFLLANVLSGKAVLPQAQKTDIYLTGLGIVLTVVYLWGLITRPRTVVLRMGFDSLTVLVLYAAGIGGLIAVTR